MPGPAGGESARAGEQARVRLRDVAVPLGVIIALGLALRLIIAYVLLPGSGFGVDRTSFDAWATALAARGPFGFYDQPGYFVDYTPGYLYVLWLLGLVSGALGGPGAAPGDLMKLPAILADAGLAITVFAMAAELGASRRAALGGAALVILNPVTWFDSAVWSQVDSVGTLVLLLAVRELWHGHSERATILTTVAAIIKPQFGILIPIAAVVILRRHLRDRWEPGRVVLVVLAGLATATLVCAPFGITIIGLLEKIVSTAGGYPYLTVNAYNPWALATMDGSGLAASGTWIQDIATSKGPEFFAIFGMPALFVGTGLLVGVIALLGLVAWRRDDPESLLVVLAVMAVAFFVLPTRVHERYLYPFFAFGAILAAVRPRRWLLPYGVLAVANLSNLYGVLAIHMADFYGVGIDPLLNAFGGAGERLAQGIRSSAGVTATAVAHAVGLLNVALLVPLGRREPDERSGEAPEDGLDERAVRAPVRPATEARGGPARQAAGYLSGHPAGPAAGPVMARHAAAGSPFPVPVPRAGAPDTPDVAVAGRARAGFLDRWARPVVDRTATLAREGGGRLDRLDVWLVLVLFVATLGLRTFRLGEPDRMHFDEVYHARTAAEFLQDWRYGMPHAIYEWTHPHLAKYAIAGGLVLFGENQVVAEARLGTTVRGVALEPRWDDTTGAPDGGPLRAGERLYAATGSELLVLDLRTRARLAAFAVAGASAVAVDQTGHRVFVGTAGGEILVGDTAATADTVRAAASGDAGASGVVPAAFATAGAAVERLWAVADGAYLVALTPGGTLVTFDAVGGAELGRVTLAGAADVADAGSTDALVADPAAIGDVQVAAAELAALLGGVQADYLPLLQSDAPEVTVSADLGDSRAQVEDAIASGKLAGFSIRPIARLAVADAAGVSLVEPSSGSVVGEVPLDAPATGLVRVEGIEDDPQLWVAAGSDVAVLSLARSSTNELPVLERTVPMPGAVERIAFDTATELVHVLGRTPDGSASTVYVVEPRGSSVFADARLPFRPVAWAGDWDGNFPAADREQLLLFAADGSAAAVATGQNAFAWRFPGVLAGALMAVLIFLLARILFRRRAVAVFAGLFTLLDGMFFVQSRIAMNDTYVGVFLLAAIVLFAGLWTGRWRARWAFWVVMPAIGVLLGLALASKWVALYAIGGLGVLVLARSALGRVLLVLGLAAISALFGYLAIAVPPANFTFLVIMVALTLLAAAVTVLHPITWTPEEVRFAVGAPFVLGVAACLAAIPLRANAPVAAAAEPGAATAHGLGDIVLFGGIALLLVGAGSFVAFLIAGRFGWGPLARPPEPDDPAALLEPPAPAPDGWLRLGSGWGIPAAWLAVCLLVIPVAVYILSYVPWALNSGGLAGSPVIFPAGTPLIGEWPPGHNGQTLWELTKSMYDYHNNLRATHAASSPWWAWPLDLKPVWFFQGSFAGATSGAIYDAGNLVIWWLSLPALAFTAWQAFRRRSLGLALIGVLFAVMWLTWSRIDRATFQYHYYTALPFAILALAYLVAELWHGPSRRTWLLARAAGAIAVLGPAILWLFLRPLCWFVDVERANAGSWACTATPSLGPEISWQAIAVGAVLLGGGLLVGWLAVRLRRANRPDASAEERGLALARVAGALIGLGIAVVGALNLVGPEPAFMLGGIPRELAAVALAVPLGVVAFLVFTARSPRRFAVGSVIAAGLFFLLLYPNWSGLPLPDSVFNAYQLLLPTWQYAFQFPVNTAEVTSVPFVDPMSALLFGAVVIAAAFIGYSAWMWRLVAAERAADEAAMGHEEA